MLKVHKGVKSYDYGFCFVSLFSCGALVKQSLICNTTHTVCIPKDSSASPHTVKCSTVRALTLYGKDLAERSDQIVSKLVGRAVCLYLSIRQQDGFKMKFFLILLAICTRAQIVENGKSFKSSQSLEETLWKPMSVSELMNPAESVVKWAQAVTLRTKQNRARNYAKVSSTFETNETSDTRRKRQEKIVSLKGIDQQIEKPEETKSSQEISDQESSSDENVGEEIFSQETSTLNEQNLFLLIEEELTTLRDQRLKPIEIQGQAHFLTPTFE